MSVFTPTKSKNNSKVHGSEYIRTENKPDDAGDKPAEPVTPTEQEAK